MYCMPQVGTKVSLYFPNFDEKNAMVVNCFRTNGGDCADMADTSKRAFNTEHGKSMILHPESMGLISQCGSYLMLDDSTGFDLNSKQKLSIMGKGIKFDAPTIHVNSIVGEINMMKIDTSFSTVYGSVMMCNQFDMIAKNGTRVVGTVFTCFEPFDDAPVEQGFNWGGLFGNVLAGLAAVGAVALTLATFGAAGPIIVGAVIGGSMAVGMVAVGDVISGEVSDVSTYMLEGLKGAATGAVFAGLGVAGQAIGKTIGCISTAGKVINVTAKVSGGLSVALGGFDITAFLAGAFAPGNPYTQLNQRLNSNKLYTGFVFAVDAISIFTMGASSSMKCFVAGTLIHIPFGLAAIETIKTGDQVISTNPETFKVAEKKVVETFVRETNELVHLTINGELIQTTTDHPFYVKNRGFVNAVELQIGDELLDSVGNALIVEDTLLEICVPAVTVYNFEVEDFHTYHVGMLGILVHNANCKLIDNGDGTYDVELSHKEDWTPQQRVEADIKCKALTEANTVKTNVSGKRDATKTSRYRKDNNILSNQDVDHTIDLQLGGIDDMTNMSGLDRSVNRSLGKQINILIGKLPEGTVLNNFRMK